MSDQEESQEQLLAEMEWIKRQRQSKLFRGSEVHYYHLFRDSAVGMVVVMTDGRITQSNKAFCDFLGYSEPELFGKTVLSTMHPDDRETTSKTVMQSLAAGIRIQHFDQRYLHKSGQVVWGEVSTTMICDAEGRPSSAIVQVLDITERKQAEEALLEREAQLLEAQEVACLGTYILDLPTGRWRSSSVLDHIFGISSDYERTVAGWAELIHPEERQKMLDYFLQEVVGEKKSFDREYRIIRYSDQQVRWVHGLGRLRYGKDGQPVYMLGTIQDITDRKRAESALKKAHDELETQVQERTVELVTANENLDVFRKFVEASGEGFGMSNFEGRIVYVNPTLCRILGEEMPEDVIGHNVAAYYSEEYLQKRKNEMIPALLQGGYWQTETTFVPRHGKPIQTLQSTFLIRDECGNPFRIAVVISDITERKQTEDALRKSNDELKAIYDGMVDGLLIADVETKRFVRANMAICRMLGYSMQELLSKSVKDIHPPNALPAMLRAFQAQAAGQIAINENAPVLRKDGSIFYADIATNSIIYDHRLYLIGFFRDITERKQAQEALQEGHRTLKHLLLSSDHERQMIAYEIHDGLAQYLAGSIMQFQAYDEFQDSMPDVARKAYDDGMRMLQQGHHEARRLIAGVRPPVLDEAGVVEAIAHLINELTREKGVKIEFNHKVEFRRLVSILENAIYRICQEGLSNSCKHSLSESIQVGLYQRGNRLRIEIRDWGIGFDTKNVKEGSYGLIGMRERARLLGGKYQIQSSAGKGTRIRVELPLMEREE